MVVHQEIPLDACVRCLNGDTPHQEWHPTRAELLRIGAEMTDRVRERERWCVRQMDDDELVGYGVRMRRMLATAKADGWDDFLIELTQEWVDGAEKEWRWRQRAASLGADAVKRAGASWADRVDVIKRETDLSLLIAFDNERAEPVGTRGWRCCCPFHADRHPSLDIDTEKGVWLCRACNIGGDAITYAELRYSLTFPGAVTFLEERLGIKPPTLEGRRIHGVEVVRPDGRC